MDNVSADMATLEPAIPMQRHAAQQTRKPSRRQAAKWVAVGAVSVVALLLIISMVANVVGGARTINYTGTTGNVDYASSPSTIAPAAAEAEADSLANGTTGAAAQGGWDRMIIRNGTVSLQVSDVETSIAQVRDVAAQAGGLVFSSNSQYQGDSLVATVTIQVPVAQFDGVMSNLRGLGVKVLNQTTTSEDVTEEYTDLASQLKNLQATEAQLRQLMVQAKTVDEILAVQGELSNVRGEIETIQGRINYLDRRADLSSITVTLLPEPVARTIEPQSGWEPLEAAERAWNSSLGFLAAAGDALITVTVFFWWLVPVLFVLFLLRGRLLGRRARALNS